MTNYNIAKGAILNDMVEVNNRMASLIEALDALDRIEDYDLIDQVTTMLKAQQMMTQVIERASKITGN